MAADRPPRAEARIATRRLRASGDDGVVARRRAGRRRDAASPMPAQAGVVVQRDAATIFAETRSGRRRQGRDLHRSRPRRRASIRSWFEQYFMTKAVPVSSASSRRCTPRFWQGGSFLYVPKGVTVELPFRSFAIAQPAGSSSSPTRWSCSRRVPRRSWSMPTSSATQEQQSFASGVVELIVGKGAQAALRPGPGLGPRRLELHDRAGGPRSTTRR